jgi:hypothetical protein
VGLRAILDTVVKRKIPIPRRESKPRTPIVQSVAQRVPYNIIPTLSEAEIGLYIDFLIVIKCV